MTSEVLALLDTRMLVLAYLCCSHGCVCRSCSGPNRQRRISYRL